MGKLCLIPGWSHSLYVCSICIWPLFRKCRVHDIFVAVINNYNRHHHCYHIPFVIGSSVRKFPNFSFQSCIHSFGLVHLDYYLHQVILHAAWFISVLFPFVLVFFLHISCLRLLSPMVRFAFVEQFVKWAWATSPHEFFVQYSATQIFPRKSDSYRA